MINADLHCHSTYSDGLLAPAEVAHLASTGGVTIWSMTDHDEVAGQHEARAAAESLGMRYVEGVEISVTWAGRTVHVVGLAIDSQNRALVDGLIATRAGRDGRGQLIAERLAQCGIEGAYEGALKYANNPALLSRTHFARFLVEHGYCESTSDVFSRYLAEGRPGFVPHEWASLEQAMSWIHGAGGTAVIAHPGRYKYSQLEFAALFDAFRDHGGDAIEVVTGSHTPDQYREYADVARRYGFRASRGSDFHGPGEGRTALGALPMLPDDLRPVWRDWQ